MLHYKLSGYNEPKLQGRKRRRTMIWTFLALLALSAAAGFVIGRTLSWFALVISVDVRVIRHLLTRSNIYVPVMSYQELAPSAP
jgi:hypothetical protein